MRLAKLREYRETEIYLIILEAFNLVVGRIVKDKKLRKLYSDAVITKGQRPWGIQKQMMNVWIVGLQCLLKDTPENKIHRKGRPSIMSLIEKELPPMPFPFTIDLMKDALRLYTSPYGQVAGTPPLSLCLPPSLPLSLPILLPSRGLYCLCLLSVFIPPDSHYLTSSLPPVFSLQTPRIIPLSPVIVSGAPRTSLYGTIHARKRP